MNREISNSAKLRRYTEFIDENPGLVEPENAMAFISDDGGVTYNRCHCKRPHLYNSSGMDSSTFSSLEQLRNW